MVRSGHGIPAKVLQSMFILRNLFDAGFASSSTFIYFNSVIKSVQV